MLTHDADEREIYRGIVKFARAMDERNWGAIESIATVDATSDLGTGTLSSRGEMIAAMRSFLDDCGPTQHMVANVLVDVDPDGVTARSRAYVSDLHLGTGTLAGESFRTLGDYHDAWAKIDGRWWMTHRTKRMSGSLGSLAVLGAGPAGWSAPTATSTGHGADCSATAITNLLYRYAEYMDRGRLEDAAALFRHAQVRVRAETTLDEAEVLALWRSSVKIHEDGTPRTKHVITNPILEIDEESGTARCRSYYTVLQATSTVPLQIIASGRYHDEFERAADGWRFTSRDYSMLDFAGNLSDHLTFDPHAQRKS